MTNSTPLYIFLGGIIVIVTAAIILVVWKYIKNASLANTKQPEMLKMPDKFSGNLRTISYYDYKTLKKATQNFNSKNQLGVGGFGPVYEGILENGTKIAVKQLALGKSQQGESEFLCEVRTITDIQHKNLVRLLGCCLYGSHRLLVYEYMQNGSLEKIIYGNSGVFLNWGIRFQIICGIAKGLQYLHEDSHLRIIHRDIKASNILLDEKYQPKIGDFGLARFFPEDMACISTNFAGTLGYTAPEYALKGELSEKADIYSFGVLVLEIICHRKNTNYEFPLEMQYLPEYAWKLYERSRLMDLLDPRLRGGENSEDEVLKVCYVALLCLQPYANVRPPMSEIVAMLTCKVKPSQLPAPLKPTVLDRRHQKVQEIVSWDCPFNSPTLTSESSSGLQPEKISA